MTDLKIKTIDVHELKKRYDTEKDLCLIDVREDDEWQAMRIPRAIHIPKNEISQKIAAYVSEFQCPIYLHCKGGVRSLYAAESLLAQGYQNVYSVDGGIMDWLNAGYPVSY